MYCRVEITLYHSVYLQQALPRDDVHQVTLGDQGFAGLWVLAKSLVAGRLTCANGNQPKDLISRLSRHAAFEKPLLELSIHHSIDCSQLMLRAQPTRREKCNHGAQWPWPTERFDVSTTCAVW
jgi:hypothetical protein